MSAEIPEKDKLDALVNAVIALCEWHATEGNPKYTFWMNQSKKLRKLFRDGREAKRSECR